MWGKIDKEFDLIHGMKVTRENMEWLFDLMENQQSELLVYPLSKLEKEVDRVIEKAAPKVTKKSRKMDDGKILDYLIVSHEAIPLVDNKTDEYIDPSKTDKFLRQAEDIRKKKVQMAKREFLAAFQKLENEFLGKITSDVVSSVHKLIYK